MNKGTNHEATFAATIAEMRGEKAVKKLITEGHMAASLVEQ
jgi:hypothetical protein